MTSRLTINHAISIMTLSFTNNRRADWNEPMSYLILTILVWPCLFVIYLLLFPLFVMYMLHSYLYNTNVLNNLLDILLLV